MPACAIIWDYDGTLVDSRHRNLSVNRSIIEDLTGRPWRDFRVLHSIEDYDAAVARCTNWRDFYQREFGLREDMLETAGRMWTRGQLTDETPVEPFAGVPEALDALGHLPHGIVSQNSRQIIEATLGPLGLRDRFEHVLGFEQVAPGRQKPAPDGLLDCLARMSRPGPRAAFYVGDHPTDAMCVAQARQEMAARDPCMDVWSIAVLYGGESTDGWPEPPDFLARTPQDIVAIVDRESPCRKTRDESSSDQALEESP
ncbi:MAG: HAD family hydrolase [Gemmatimonadetes bacterium]|nr:HAD family hydrolase [Gemmatimonadota bacterium]